MSNAIIMMTSNQTKLLLATEATRSLKTQSGVHAINAGSSKRTALRSPEVHFVRGAFSRLVEVLLLLLKQPLVLVKNGPGCAKLRLVLKYWVVEILVVAKAAVDAVGGVLDWAIPWGVAWVEGQGKKNLNKNSCSENQQNKKQLKIKNKAKQTTKKLVKR